MINSLIEFVGILLKWGLWIAIYGIITIIVGITILLIFKEPVERFIKSLEN